MRYCIQPLLEHTTPNAVEAEHFAKQEVAAEHKLVSVQTGREQCRVSRVSRVSRATGEGFLQAFDLTTGQIACVDPPWVSKVSASRILEEGRHN